MKKLSELMLEGYSMVGHQTKDAFCRGNPKNPRSVCALGAINLAVNGNANDFPSRCYAALDQFNKRVGIPLATLNDEGMSIPDIAGIAAAEGL